MKKVFSVDSLLNLQRPTDRVPMDLSLDGRLLAVSVQGIRQETVGIREDGFGADGI